MSAPRVLILSASVGSGHMRAASAVEGALRETYPGARVKTVDILEMANAAFRKLYGDGYLGLANAAPHLLGYLYDALDRPIDSFLLGDAARRFVQRWSLRTFPAFLREEPWDVIVNTHFLPAEMVALLRRRAKIDIPQVTAVTDFEAHRLWAQSPCEHYFAASADGAACLRQWGAPPESITISGIPIDPAFSRPLKRGACLKSQGLAGDRPIILQLSGGSGLGPMDEVFSALLAIEVPCDLVVVTGRNEQARARLSRRAAHPIHRVHVLGYTQRVHELMTVADLVVSKPGGLTTSEVLACGAAMVAVNPIPGQESRNCDFLLENGAAVKVNAIAALPEKLTSLLSSPARLSLLRENARRLGRPRAAFEVARAAVALARAPRAQASGVLSAAKPAEPALASQRQAESRSH